MQSKPKKTVLVLGSVGVGKSNFGNFFLDGRASNRFLAGNSSVSGLTTEIRIAENWALNNPSNEVMRFIDMPGFGDPHLPLENFA